MKRYQHNLNVSISRKTVGLILKVTCILLLIGKVGNLMATGEPSTYFNIYVPPNNDAVKRNVALIVTAINDSTYFSINDDAADGDDDDSVEGWLMAGQSYVLYIKDNGINDDARYASGGVLKQDGDYFTIESNKLVYASMSTDSDWQHDFVAAVNKKSVGGKFIVYAPKTTNSPRDLNIFAFEESTTFTVSRISKSNTTQTGYTDVDIYAKEIVIQKTLNPGEDIIHLYGEGRDLMQSGETYLIESNKDVAVQYGALYRNARDGGAYVPSQNGSSSGSLFYFAVPYQSGGEQEIRIVSWDDNNDVVLERYSNGSWITMNSWNLNTFGASDWVGKNNGNSSYPTVFRVSCSSEKKVSVFEANWMETGSIGTSDMATMLSADNGNSSGRNFLAYIAPPGNEQNVTDPFTGQKIGESLSHIYLFASKDTATVVIKDTETDGSLFSKSVTILPYRYADIQITKSVWEAMMSAGKPYLKVTSDKNVAALNTNFNDNWMCYFGSSLPQSFKLSNLTNEVSSQPGDTVVLKSTINVESGTLESTNVEIKIGSGAIPVDSKLTNTATNESIEGTIDYQESESIISFQNEPAINSTDDYVVETSLVFSASYNDGEPISDGTVITTETIVNGYIEETYQESIITQGIQNNADTDVNLLFSDNCQTIENNAVDSWNGAWVDVDNDGWQDLIVSSKDPETGNKIYKNTNSLFSAINSGDFQQLLTNSVATIWGDVNNDGLPDVFVVNATGKASYLYQNEGNFSFRKVEKSGIAIHPQYFHGAAFEDLNNDGLLDLVVTNFFETRFHQLYQNEGNFSFSKITDSELATISARAMAPLFADFNNDGLVDLFIPNGNNEPNTLLKNLGNFRFKKITRGKLVTDTKNSVGAAWGDYDNDGDLDIVVLNASNQANDLYTNQGNGSFTYESESIISQDLGHSHGAEWLDFDNDMDLDLFITNDQGANFLYKNNGRSGFEKVLYEKIAANTGSSYGFATADYDKDGDLDIYSFTHGNENNDLFCNNGNDNNWLQLKLEGSLSNRSAIGANITLHSGDIKQYRTIHPVKGFGSQSSLLVHFGLGSNSQADSILIEWPSGKKQIIENVAANQIVQFVEPSSALISGVCFHDENLNGVKDSTENTVENIQLQISSADDTFVTTSGKGGGFSLGLANGNYSIELLPDANWSSSAQSITVASQLDDQFIEIPLTTENLSVDLQVSAQHTAWRKGFKNNTLINLNNLGTAIATEAVITVQYPEDVHLLEADHEYTLLNDSTYLFVFDSMELGNSSSINIVDSVGLTHSTGDVLPFSLSVVSDQIDSDLLNNEYEEAIEVVGAIDPNDMLVSPRGLGEEGYINKTEWLTYTIRFQNVGSYYATYVTLENPLSSHLDLSTFEMIESSHQASYSITEGVLNVFYNNIQLVSAEVDEVNSHGYFRYRIKAKNSCRGGEKITSQTAITFDFEKPIYTNTLLNTIQYSGRGPAGKLMVYPNPATDSVHLQVQEDYFQFADPLKFDHLIILAKDGQLIEKTSGFNTTQIELVVDRLPSGLYFLKATTQDGRVFTGKLIKQ